MNIPSILRACPLFFELYDKEIEKIVKACNVLSFKESEKIVNDGEEGNQIFVVLDGKAYVEKDLVSKKIFIQDLNSGDVFGEMVLVGEQIRSADIISKGKSSILEIPYNHIFRLYKKEPKIFGLLMLNMSRLLTKKLKATNQIIRDLQNKSKVS